LSRRAVIPTRAVLIGAGAILLVLILLIARGCGDGSLSERELRTQASAICTRANAATDRIAVPNAPLGGERFLAEGLVLMRPAIVRLRALKAPEQLRERYEHAVAASQRQLDLITRSLSEIRAGTDTIDGFRLLQQELEPVSNQANANWNALRIPACVSR
jgi:hypothetical protein